MKQNVFEKALLKTYALQLEQADVGSYNSPAQAWRYYGRADMMIALLEATGKADTLENTLRLFSVWCLKTTPLGYKRQTPWDIYPCVSCTDCATNYCRGKVSPVSMHQRMKTAAVHAATKDSLPAQVVGWATVWLLKPDFTHCARKIAWACTYAASLYSAMHTKKKNLALVMEKAQAKAQQTQAAELRKLIVNPFGNFVAIPKPTPRKRGKRCVKRT